jgi:hypothetical protein
MFDKLSLLNSALKRTGNNPVDFEGDDSPEWLVMDDAYETELPLLIERRDWGFASTLAPLTRIGDSEDPRFADAFAKPIGCLHLRAVTIGDAPAVYDIIDNKVHCTARGTLPVARFIRIPSADQWPPSFLETLRLKLMAHAYRALNEDTGEAERSDAKAEAMLSEAATRTGQEKPPKAMVNSKLRAARRIRRG